MKNSSIDGKADGFFNKVEAIALYEVKMGVPYVERITQWFGDYGLYEPRLHVTNEAIEQKFEEISGKLDELKPKDHRKEQQSAEWQEKIRRAREVSIVDVVKSAGYQLSGMGTLLSTKEYYGIKVHTDTNSYYNWGTKKGGTPIDFLINECGMEKKDAINRLAVEGGYIKPATDQEGQRTPKQQTDGRQSKTHDEASFLMPDKAENNKRVYAYLSSRGIKGEITHDFIHKGLLYESAEKHNCVFVGLDDAGVPMAGYMRGTNTYAKTPFRGNVPGSNKEYGVFYDGVQDATSLCCFEAPIDMMSFIQLRDTPSHKLAMCGVDDTSIARVLARYPEIKKICFCLDNDEPGRETAAELKEKYESLGYEAHEVFPPEGKDWNEWLNIKRSMEVEVKHGNTLGEYKQMHPNMESYCAEYGEDISGGFGRKGWSAYGNCDNMRVMDVITLTDGTTKIILGNSMEIPKEADHQASQEDMQL